jgi:hypothetical protein
VLASWATLVVVLEASTYVPSPCHPEPYLVILSEAKDLPVARAAASRSRRG